jgi:hypothetical protein
MWGKDFFNKVNPSARLLNLTILELRNFIEGFYKENENTSHEIIICNTSYYRRLIYTICKYLT